MKLQPYDSYSAKEIEELGKQLISMNKTLAPDDDLKQLTSSAANLKVLQDSAEIIKNLTIAAKERRNTI